MIVGSNNLSQLSAVDLVLVGLNKQRPGHENGEDNTPTSKVASDTANSVVGLESVFGEGGSDTGSRHCGINKVVL